MHGNSAVLIDPIQFMEAPKTAGRGMPQHFERFKGLLRQRNNMRSPHLHALGWNLPARVFSDDLLPFCLDQFGRPHKCQRHKLQAIRPAPEFATSGHHPKVKPTAIGQCVRLIGWQRLLDRSIGKWHIPISKAIYTLLELPYTQKSSD